MRPGARRVAFGAPPTSGSAARAGRGAPSTAKSARTRSARFRTTERFGFRFTVLLSLDEEVLQDGEERDASEEAVDIGLDASRLHFAKAVAGGECAFGDEVDGAVDEVVIDGAGDPSGAFGEDRGAVDDAVDHPSVHIGENETEFERPADEGRLVNLVDPVLVLDRLEERQRSFLLLPIARAPGAVATAGSTPRHDGQTAREDHEGVFEAEDGRGEEHLGVREHGVAPAFE